MSWKKNLKKENNCEQNWVGKKIGDEDKLSLLRGVKKKLLFEIQIPETLSQNEFLFQTLKLDEPDISKIRPLSCNPEFPVNIFIGGSQLPLRSTKAPKTHFPSGLRKLGFLEADLDSIFSSPLFSLLVSSKSSKALKREKNCHFMKFLLCYKTNRVETSLFF